MPPLPAINIQSVTKSYGDHLVLDSLSLQIEQGAFFGLTGVNGIGKTTLIRCLLDFCDIDAGQISIFGQTHLLPAAREPLVFLPEKFTPPYYLTGLAYLDFIARMHKSDYDQQALENLCEALELDSSVLKKPVKNYSKGMAQKLGIAASLSVKKKCLILDEPMSGLDPKARTAFKRRLLTLKDDGVTVFFSTHLLVDVEDLCDQMAILHDGCITFTGTPGACCEQYHAISLEEAFMNCINAPVDDAVI